jgi:PqqD family protein of HPr-rel-A system
VKQTRYEVVAGLRIASFEDELVVFNPTSWETHVLRPAASLLLEAALSAPCTESQFLAVLEQALDDEDRPQATEHARRLLAELLQLRLLRQPPADADADR